MSHKMLRLNPEKLHVRYVDTRFQVSTDLPRRYTLTHSDRTGELFLTISDKFDTKQVSGLYTRLMRDEVFAELLIDGVSRLFSVYCHVSGGIVIGPARWRYDIFRTELPLVLEAIRYGDRIFFESDPTLDQIPIHVHFNSTHKKYNKIESWGTFADYR